MEGVGIFETIRVEKGKAILINYHYKRLKESAKELGIPFYLSEEKFEKLLLEECASSEKPVLVRFTLSFNEKFSLKVRECIQRNEVSLLPLPFPKRTYDKLSKYKTTDIAKSLFALETAKSKGFNEALLFSHQNFVSETAFANIFFVKNGIFYTPSLKTGCLPGTRRRVVIEILKEFGIEVVEGFFYLKDLLNADEIFITSAREDIVKVKKIGNRKTQETTGISWSERIKNVITTKFT
ncbi:branched-chain amino acid aminotransferase/4-amino-4-deoxychorismate lyase [Desulfurobacterium pacificum]|uniref:branched-chain-amino-acid transaminase n=1 Tax=Desulfurobacterium pacificum TaxID=240166 RepID=A0ABY1N8S1_9BACT|nr:aminotransferase class IV [Desulfurobacterium pacificum]SMP03475.1 branched-chain amino acid aminotransferase/4-amino-4-deoxychorismate lyase [Desulfurobacterium pacificum]